MPEGGIARQLRQWQRRANPRRSLPTPAGKRPRSPQKATGRAQAPPQTAGAPSSRKTEVIKAYGKSDTNNR
eukprot:2080567-Pyramimonas_sp.AAC.1